MNRPMDDLPERLIESDATAFERRVLGAALQKQPSRAASARMAKALGVTVAAVGTATAATTLAADVAVTKATARCRNDIAVALDFSRRDRTGRGRCRRRNARRRHAARAPSSLRRSPLLCRPHQRLSRPNPLPWWQSRRRARSPRLNAVAPYAAGDLRDQVAFIDSARTAMSTGSSRRALEILRRYLDKYPAGQLPSGSDRARGRGADEARSRGGEARALAERFVAEHRGSLLARRVADVAGLTAP